MRKKHSSLADNEEVPVSEEMVMTEDEQLADKEEDANDIAEGVETVESPYCQELVGELTDHCKNQHANDVTGEEV